MMTERSFDPQTTHWLVVCHALLMVTIALLAFTTGCGSWSVLGMCRVLWFSVSLNSLS